MPNINKWKIFNKQGSPITLFQDSYIDLIIEDTSGGKEADGYFITNPDGIISSVEMINSGHSYVPSTTTISYKHIMEDDVHLVPPDSSVIYKDVSIFSPSPQNVKGISDIKVDISTLYPYPSVVYTGNIYLTPVSQGLVETEHLFILEESSGGFIKPYDASNGSMVFQMIGDEDQIKFFQVDEITQTVQWSDIIYVELGNSSVATTPYFDSNENIIMDLGVSPITINVGFRSDEDGVFKRTMRAYHVVNGEYYTVAEIVVNAQAIAEDERFRTLLGNFGLPDPMDFPHLFKETDINEDLPDYSVINSKSKHMILEHHNIMPYIGTYKALINAIRWLGYDDIYIREWFKNVKDGKKLSLLIPYDAKERSRTILSFTPEQRKILKKLNQLSLIYCLTRETGEVDEFGVPITENCYSYNLDEVLVKLLALKKWLEENIIGVNARIIDITGEGVYFERYKSTLYSTGSIGYSDTYKESMTPYSF